MSVPVPALSSARRRVGPSVRRPANLSLSYRRRAPRAGPWLLLALCAGWTGWVAPAPAPAQHRTVLAHQESPLPDVPYDPDTRAVVVSADGSRSVPVVRTGDKLHVLDGYPSPGYDALSPGSPLLSPDGRHCAYAARRENVWLNEGLWYVVFDGAELGPFFTVQPHSLAFSPDGIWLACVCGSRDGKEAVCVFSPEAPAAAAPAATQPAPGPVIPPAVHTDVGKWYDRVGDHPPRFSPNGQYLAYAARRDGAWHVLLNGVEGAPYDSVGPPRFCPSGAVLGYVARREGKAVVVTLPVWVASAIGAESEAHDDLSENSFTFSFDGRHRAYVAGKPGAMSVFLDGSEVKPPKPASGGPMPNPAPFDQVAAGSLVFSPDGLHLAFAASRGGRWFIVRDGIEGAGYAGLGPNAPAFSNDGKRLAWVAERLVPAGRGGRDRLQRFVVVDGVEQKPCDRIDAGPMFSADGRRCVYVAERGTESFVVIDGMEGKGYGCIRGLPVLAPDGSRCAFTALPPDEAGRFSAAEEVARDPADPSAGSRLVFDRAPGFQTLSDEQKKLPVRLMMVEERVMQE